MWMRWFEAGDDTARPSCFFFSVQISTFSGYDMSQDKEEEEHLLRVEAKLLSCNLTDSLG